MPLNNERPTSTSRSEDQGSDAESSLASDLDCSRDSFNSDGSSKHCTPSSSPPRTLPRDEVMEAGRYLFNLKLVHEIVVGDVRAELSQGSQNSLWNMVRQNLYKAFWDKLENQQATLTGQICSISQKENPIRTLVEDRVQQYFRLLLSDPKNQTKLEEVSASLTAIKPELVAIGKTFISLINYNRAVYGPFYMDIIRKLLFGSSPPTPIPHQQQAPNCHVSHE
uniref:T-complex 11, testis-specific-like 2 n=1 Tax=Poecilia reticulata TaxID=8081 RepID=A0A3P9MW77_POERE